MAFEDNNAVSDTGLGKPVDPSRKVPAKYPEKKAKVEKSPAPQPVAPSHSSGGFFTIYKRGQGYWTRMGTALAAGLLGALTASFIYDQINANWAGHNGAAVGVAAGFLAGFALLVFWVINRPQHVDFLIATDSEMKKVNWTSRKELIGSTKVVIFFMFFIAISLFVIDILFGYFFHLIGVLKTNPFGS